jgi:RNA polymerase sigma-70 factor (ECF subfamily)
MQEPSEERTDDALMILLQEGDASAFDALVQRHQSALIGFFVKNTRDVQLSEDLTQETLLKVYNQAWDYLPLGRFRAWMYRIGRNLLIDNVRRRSHDALVRAVKGRSEDESDALARLAEDLSAPGEQAEQRELARLLNEFLEEIPDEQRQTVTLHYYVGLSLPDVAEIMETPLATCKSRLRLAREKIGERLRRLSDHSVVTQG